MDAAGEAFVVGTTLSPDFPVTPGALNTLCGGDGECGASWNTQGFIVSNAFVSKLNTAGSGLVYSTYLGEYENVQGFAIAVDGDLNAYVTGTTSPNFQETVLLIPPAAPPPPFPITASAFEKTYNNQPEDGFGSAQQDRSAMARMLLSSKLTLPVTESSIPVISGVTILPMDTASQLIPPPTPISRG